MLEDFMDMKGVNDVDDDKTFRKRVANLVGTHTSADGAAVATITAKVDKDLS